MTLLAGHSGGTVEGSHSPASVVMPGNTALTAAVTRDPGTIAVNGITKATQREMATAVGMSIGWVNRLLKWRQAGYKDASPFGPTTRQERVQHAEQRHRRHRSEKSVDADHRTIAQDCTAAGPANAAAPAITNSARSSGPVQRRRSPSETTLEFKFAIDQWWPLLDEAGRAEIVAYFNEKTKPRAS